MAAAKKNLRKAKHIIANSITLTDKKGRPRILLDAGDGDGFVTICLFGENGRSIQIAASREGGLSISLLGTRSTVSATLGMNADEHTGLSIHDNEGKLGTMLGSNFFPGKHSLVLFQKGQPCYVAPKRLKKKPSRRKNG